MAAAQVSSALLETHSRELVELQPCHRRHSGEAADLTTYSSLGEEGMADVTR